MAAPLRSTLAAGNVVLLGRIRLFNLRARGKDLLRRSVDVGLHDDGLLTARPCRSSVSRQRTGIHPLDRPRDNLISVTFAMAATEFAETSQVVKIISGEIEPP